MKGWFSFYGEIDRVTSIIRLLILWIIPAVLFYFVRDMIRDNWETRSYFILKLAISFLIVLLGLPSVVKRLRNISWSIYWAGLGVLISVLDMQLLIFLGFTLTAFFTYAIFTVFLVWVVILSILALKKGRSIPKGVS